MRRLLRKKRHFATRYSSLYVCIFYTKIANLIRLAAAAQGVVDCARGGSPMQNLLLFWLRITLHFSSAADCLHSLPLQQCERRRQRWNTLHTLAALAAAACIGCNGRARLHREGGYVTGACSCFRGCAISLQRSWTTVNNFWCIIIIIIVKKVQLVLPKLQVWDQSKIFNGKLQMYFCNAAAAAVHKCRSSSQ